MKIIQISDTHLVAPGRLLYGLDPRERLERCIEDINRTQADAALCILTGDLCDAGEPEAYRALRSCLKGLALPYRLMIGNHDDREAFAAAFPEVPRDPNGFIQSVVDCAAGRLLLLDTVEAGDHAGHYCALRADWLGAQLDAAADQPAYLFLHHPPFEIAIPCLDDIRIKDPAAFARALAGRSNLRHIFFGHVHRPVSGSWRAIPFSALRSTAHQVPLEMGATAHLDGRMEVPKVNEPGGYAVILIDAERVIVHLHDLLPGSHEIV